MEEIMNEDDGSRVLQQSRRDLLDYIDEELAAILGGDFPGSYSPAGSDDSNTSALCPAGPPPSRLELPKAEPQKRNGSISNITAAESVDINKLGSSVILNFENANISRVTSRNEGPTTKRPRGPSGSKTARSRPASQTYDHIMAERKRREQLSQCFIALSGIVPGLKKMDKTSVLGDTIKYLKYLKERVKTLEGQLASKHTMESVALVKKSTAVEEDECSSDEKSQPDDQSGLPDIEARVCGRSILLKVYCEQRKGFLVQLLAEVEKLDLSVVNTSVTPVGNFALDITVIAEMDKEVMVSSKDIVKALRSAL